jgi:curved DNA-binding protein CbpA
LFSASTLSEAKHYTNRTLLYRAALKYHPDRVPQDSPERRTRTRKFQQINDAYYTLSDPTRRREYDATRTYQSFSSSNTNNAPPGGFGFDADEDDEPEEQEIPRPEGGTGGFGGFSFPWSAFGFGGAPGGTTEDGHTRFANDQFGSVFEEMLREEGMAEGDNASPTGKFWSVIGGLSGGAMGFILANFPGMVAGAVAGNRLGHVRDAKGKSVYSVFQELPQADKARLLSDLAARVFASAVGS